MIFIQTKGTYGNFAISAFVLLLSFGLLSLIDAYEARRLVIASEIA